MSFEAIRGARGQPRVRGICDDCGKSEVVSAVHGKSGTDGEGQAANKLQHQGWSFIHKHLRFPTCEFKRKVVKMPMKETTEEAPKEPTKTQKRQIMSMLEEVYDTDAERYRGGDTDDAVAEVLGVMPGWVAQLRDEFFGPDGGNEDIEALEDQITEWVQNAEKGIRELTDLKIKLMKVVDQGGAMTDDLAKIKKAIGPRNVAKAGLR